jgi:hypothetical protein
MWLKKFKQIGCQWYKEIKLIYKVGWEDIRKKIHSMVIFQQNLHGILVKISVINKIKTKYKNLASESSPRQKKIFSKNSDVIQNYKEWWCNDAFALLY